MLNTTLIKNTVLMVSQEGPRADYAIGKITEEAERYAREYATEQLHETLFQPAQDCTPCLEEMGAAIDGMRETLDKALADLQKMGVKE